MDSERQQADESGYPEQEIQAVTVENGEEEDFGEEEQVEEGDEEEIPLSKMKEVILALQVGLRERDLALLQAKKQNIELLGELEKLSEQYIRDQSKEADQLSKVKQYEEEFMEIQKGKPPLASHDNKARADRQRPGASRRPPERKGGARQSAGRLQPDQQTAQRAAH